MAAVAPTSLQASKFASQGMHMLSAMYAEDGQQLLRVQRDGHVERRDDETISAQANGHAMLASCRRC